MEKMRSIKKRGRNTKRIFVLLVLLGIITTLTPTVGATVLWVVPDNPTWYFTGPNDDDDFLLDETVIVDTNMDSTFSGNVLVLNHAPAQDDNVAKDVYLKFFVHDDSNIVDITIGTAKRIQPKNLTHPTIDPNPNSTSTPATLFSFPEVAKNPPVPAGYGVNYSIGDIPYHGGENVGNPDPEGDEGPFNPGNADYYIKVPFTINFGEPPEVGFTLYVYAENPDEQVKTAYSHDGGFTHVPEFTTIAIPVASILGLLFFFNRRKHRKAK